MFEKFKAGVVVATGGVALYYLASMILGLVFGMQRFTIFAGGIPGILISAVIVIIAAMNLIVDF